MLTSDLHLGHKNIANYRDGFGSSEEHHEIIFDNLATNIHKADSLIMLGDIAFTREWLFKLNQVKCKKKTLILGNHDTEHLHIHDLVQVFDDIHGLWSKRNYWFSHAPIHEQEMRRRVGNIHGHTHTFNVLKSKFTKGAKDEVDTRYYNVCVDKTDFKPISFADIQERTNNFKV